MNLLEEINKASHSITFYDGNTDVSPNLITDTDVERIAESYAKEKAWNVWEAFSYAVQGTKLDEQATKQAFNEWWEENK